MIIKNRTIYCDYLSLSQGSMEELSPSCSLWQHMGWAVKDHKGAIEKSGSCEHWGAFSHPLLLPASSSHLVPLVPGGGIT